MNADTVVLNRSTYDELMYIKQNMEKLEKGNKTIIVGFHENQSSGYFSRWKFFTENEVVSVCDRKIKELEDKIKSLEVKYSAAENLGLALTARLIEAESKLKTASKWWKFCNHKRKNVGVKNYPHK